MATTSTTTLLGLETKLDADHEILDSFYSSDLDRIADGIGRELGGRTTSWRILITSEEIPGRDAVANTVLGMVAPGMKPTAVKELEKTALKTTGVWIRVTYRPNAGGALETIDARLA